MIEVLPSCVHDGLAGQPIAPSAPALLRVPLQTVRSIPVNHPASSWQMGGRAAMHEESSAPASEFWRALMPSVFLLRAQTARSQFSCSEKCGCSDSSPSHICLVHTLKSKQSQVSETKHSGRHSGVSCTPCCSSVRVYTAAWQRAPTYSKHTLAT